MNFAVSSDRILSLGRYASHVDMKIKILKLIEVFLAQYVLTAIKYFHIVKRNSLRI